MYCPEMEIENFRWYLKGNVLNRPLRYVAFYDLKGKEIQPMGLHKRLAVEGFGWHYESADCTLDAYQKDVSGDC